MVRQEDVALINLTKKMKTGLQLLQLPLVYETEQAQSPLCDIRTFKMMPMET